MADIFHLNTDTDSEPFQQISDALTTLKGEVDGFIMKNEIDTVDVDQQHPACKQDAGKWTIDMESAKTNVAEDLEICVKRVNNIKAAIDAVLKNHNSLQQDLANECNRIRKEYDLATTGSTESSQSDDLDEGFYDDTGYSDGGGYYGGSTGGSTSGDCEDCDDSEEDLDDLEEDPFAEEEEELDEEEEEEEDTDVEPGTIETELTLAEIAYKYAGDFEEGSESWNLFNTPGLIEYDENGYARICPENLPEGSLPEDIDVIGKERRYVVSCNSSVGQVGDVIRFQQKNGDIVECVIGYNDDTEGNENTLRFFVDENKVVETEDGKVFNGETELIKNLFTENESYSHIVKTPFTMVENKSIIVEKENIINEIMDAGTAESELV